MFGLLFEAAVSAVQSDRAGDLFLYACAFTLIGALIIKYNDSLKCHVSLCLTVAQARSPPQFYAQQSGPETHRGPPLAPFFSINWPSGFGQALEWTHLSGANVRFIGRI